MLNVMNFMLEYWYIMLIPFLVVIWVVWVLKSIVKWIILFVFLFLFVLFMGKLFFSWSEEEAKVGLSNYINGKSEEAIEYLLNNFDKAEVTLNGYDYEIKYGSVKLSGKLGEDVAMLSVNGGSIEVKSNQVKELLNKMGALIK